MPEPAAIWSQKLVVFDQSLSLTQNVILSHARVALHALIQRIDRIRELVKEFPALIDFHVHPDIPSTLSDLGFQQGLASTILFNADPRGSRENAKAYQLRLERLAYVQLHCAGAPTAVLSNRKARNALAHIDEYLVRELAKPHTGWMIDSAIARRDQFTAPPGITTAFCRMYISSEDVLLHLGQEIPLTNLRTEAKAVLSAIWDEPA